MSKTLDTIQEEVDTGLWALSVVAAVLRAGLDLDALRRDRRTTAATADELAAEARKAGFRAKATRSSVARLATLPCPVVAERRDGSFFVIAKSSADGAIVSLPEAGPAEWDVDQLSREWTGVAVFVTRRVGDGDGGGRAFGFGWFAPVILQHKAALLEALLISFVLQILALAAPLFTQVIVDKVLVHGVLTTLQVIIVALIGVNVVDATLGWLRTYAFAHATSRIDAVLGARIYEHLLALPLPYFESRATGQSVARVMEVEHIRQFLTSSALTLVVDVVFSLVFLGLMLSYDVALTLVVLASLPLYALTSLVVTPIMRARVAERFRLGALNQSLLVESVSGIGLVKAMAVEPHLRERWNRQLAAYVWASLRVVTIGATGSQLVTLLNKICIAAVLYFGAQAVIGERLSVGALIAFNMLTDHVSQPVLRLSQCWQDFQQFRLSIDRLSDVMNAPREPSARNPAVGLRPLKGAVAFQDVTFRYGPRSREALSGLTLAIPAGAKVAVVGRSGSGKSTLARLILKLHAPDRGRILVDGMDVAGVDTAWLRRQIGVVQQDNLLFAGTIRDNIALAQPSASGAAVEEAARIAGAHDFILDLPNGYDTMVEERGANLSGGQRQRLAIARALVVNPRILILDEATSALDLESERHIQDNMRRICEGRTVIMIAHRLSTVRDADVILVLDGGRLVEAGAHDELATRRGVYASLLGASEPRA